jgi:hypothetical protein
MIILSSLLLVFATPGSGTPMANVPTDGFYRVTSGGVLGQPIHYTIKSAYVVSENNLNATFHVQFITPFIRLPEGEVDRSVLVVGGRRFEARQTGANQSTESIYDFFQSVSEQDAPAIARFFKIQPRMRKHPGYRLATSFSPTRELWKPGEKVVVKMTIVNVGTEAVRFLVGGRNRGPRDNQFAFSLMRDNEGVRDTGEALNFGGLSTPKVLKPGEKLEKAINLAQWFDTAPPGVYTGTGTYAVDFVSDDGALDCVWKDVLAGEFTFQRTEK